MPLVEAGGRSELAPESEAHERARKIKPEYSHGEPRRVATAAQQAEAEWIQNLLLEEGIPSLVRRSAGFEVPDFLAAGPRDLLVPESGVEAARDVLLQADLGSQLAQAPDPAFKRRAALTAGALVAGAGLTSFVAWEIVRAAG
jgi:hypothetical protein